jgi:hypothetical protein
MLSPPLLAGEARPRRLLFPVRPHVNVLATCAALAKSVHDFTLPTTNREKGARIGGACSLYEPIFRMLGLEHLRHSDLVV